MILKWSGLQQQQQQLSGCVEVMKRTSVSTWWRRCVACNIVILSLSSQTPTSAEMSLHIESDGALMESTVTRLSTTPTLSISVAGDTSFCSAAKKSTSALRVIGRCRSTTSGEPTRPTTTARQSLLGRPVTVRPSRPDARYRRVQVAVYNFLERPKNWRSILYHLFVWVSCVFLSNVYTQRGFKSITETALETPRSNTVLLLYFIVTSQYCYDSQCLGQSTTPLTILVRLHHIGF